jgi:hypothetical protein
VILRASREDQLCVGFRAASCVVREAFRRRPGTTSHAGGRGKPANSLTRCITVLYLTDTLGAMLPHAHDPMLKAAYSVRCGSEPAETGLQYTVACNAKEEQITELLWQESYTVKTFDKCLPRASCPGVLQCDRGSP